MNGFGQQLLRSIPANLLPCWSAWAAPINRPINRLIKYFIINSFPFMLWFVYVTEWWLLLLCLEAPLQRRHQTLPSIEYSLEEEINSARGPIWADDVNYALVFSISWLDNEIGTRLRRSASGTDTRRLASAKIIMASSTSWFRRCLVTYCI
jgi:hypothetical protein